MGDLYCNVSMTSKVWLAIKKDGNCKQDYLKCITELLSLHDNRSYLEDIRFYTLYLSHVHVGRIVLTLSATRVFLF